MLLYCHKQESERSQIAIWYSELVGGILNKNVYRQVIKSYSGEAE